MSVVALRFNKPLFEVAKWKFNEVKRHFLAWRYEIERHKRDADNNDEL